MKILSVRTDYEEFTFFKSCYNSNFIILILLLCYINKDKLINKYKDKISFKKLGMICRNGSFHALFVNYLTLFIYMFLVELYCNVI